MSEEYLSGFCPRCGEALTVPAKLSEFSCMFCGARLSADELLDTPAGPAVSLAPDEAALRFEHGKKAASLLCAVLPWLSEKGHEKRV